MHDDDNEIKLRAHIRENLLDYAHEHLTVDHVQYLQSAVSQQLTKMLKQIPTHEPGHLALPVDPLETLKTRLKLGSLPAYDEALELDADVMEYIKKSLVFKGKVRTQRLWEEEDEVDYSSRLHRPMTPIVSRSSKKKTPQLGRKSTEDASLAASLPSYITKRIPDEGMPERKHENLHDLMDVKLTVDAETHTKLTTYRQLTPFLSRANKTYPHPKHIDAFLRSQSPPPDQRFTLMSPPIFARDRRARQTERDSDAENEKAFNFIPLNSVEVAAKLGQTVDVDDIDPDIADANMVVVDGWATLASSASPGRGTPSLSSGISEVDELDDDPDLWRPSSEAVPASIELWHDAKMGERYISSPN
ncbi:hypothetical protein DFH11DRAFT_1546203 [Phellopilus nigrolimitatus]|nr:hypothetical protein DFH11DRAFT_1546203 [Phellopilus nigrolimitatus]